MVATKTQLIQFILDTFTTAEGDAVSKAKLDGYKKSELEEFVNTKSSEAEFNAWLESQTN